LHLEYVSVSHPAEGGGLLIPSKSQL
jgi:hypothetical protein